MYVIEYSVSQKRFHVCKIEEMLKNNIENIKKEKSLDYIPVGFVKTHKETIKFIDMFKKIVLGE